MKKTKFISFALAILLTNVIMGQNKIALTKTKDTVSEIKISPIAEVKQIQAPKVIICGPSRSALIKLLYVLNGKIIDQIEFNKINRNEIDSLQVLNPNEAKLIYGEQGSNGAITITTKKKN